jgi:response regulator RpfG family c-di-GMP phosphodiesterase
MSESGSNALVNFADEDEPVDVEQDILPPWKLMIVDDEDEIHAVTRLVLADFEYHGRSLQLISAYSAREAKELLSLHPDIAIALVDVVMEKEHAGLELVDYIRSDLKNAFIRIVLRTGQPGYAPEREVVQNYDINDYKEKTELTAQKLFSCIFTALGNYRALVSLDANRRGLIKIVDASTDLFKRKALDHFIQGVLEQISALLFLDKEAVYVQKIGIAANADDDQQVIVAATGELNSSVGKDPRSTLSADVNKKIQTALDTKQSYFLSNSFTGYFGGSSNVEAVIYLASSEEFSPPDNHLLEVFFKNISIGLINLQLRQDIEDTQKEIVFLLSDAVETRSNETGNHVKRVAEMSRELARIIGLSEEEAAVLYAAAPLHDVGKVGIPDAILNKEHSLNEEEWQVMQTHTRIGKAILEQSKRPVLQAAATIAGQHHENWDGSGYPQRLKGDEIHIFARIVSISDVVDALCSERCYKSAWEIDAVLEYMLQQRGKKFDPQLLDLLVENMEKFIHIRQQFPDPR